MPHYDIKNRNGSLVFVRGLRVKPYAKFSAHLDPITAKELVRYGVSLTLAGTPTVEEVLASVSPEPLPPMEVEEAAVLEPEMASEPEAFVFADEPALEDLLAEEAPPEEPEAPFLEEPLLDSGALTEEPAAEEPAAEEPAAEEPAAEEPAAEEPASDSVLSEESSFTSDEGGRRRNKKNRR